MRSIQTAYWFLFWAFEAKKKQNKKTPKHESNFVIFPLGFQCTSIKSRLIACSFTSEFHVRHSKYFYLFSVKYNKLSHKGCSVLMRCECLLFFFFPSLPSLNQVKNKTKKNNTAASEPCIRRLLRKEDLWTPPLLLFTATLHSAAFKPPSMWFSAPLQSLW